MSVIKDYFIRDLRDIKDYSFQRDEKSYKILQIPDLLYEFYQGSKGFEGFFE
jgi:hypothetical protein